MAVSNSGNAWAFATDYGAGHLFLYFIPSTSCPNNLPCGSGAMPPKDAWSIDKKIDDGKPAMGNVMTVWSGGCTNASDQTTLSATYSLSSTAARCSLYMIPNF